MLFIKQLKLLFVLCYHQKTSSTNFCNLEIPRLGHWGIFENGWNPGIAKNSY